MDRKKVRIFRKGDIDQTKKDLAFWLSKTPQERIEAVELLSKQRFGEVSEMKKVVRVYKREGNTLKLVRKCSAK
jgi:hypothetical protein